ncbi:MAG: hypothetical protein AAGA56_16675 [Myxococcota bacterium]
MCIFAGSSHVHVASTRILVRATPQGEHVLVYSMEVELGEPVAMIVPLPVASPQDEAVAFIDLSDYPSFFADLDRGFPPRMVARGFAAADLTLPASLAVHAVGDFVASFVPRAQDFSRLDPMFRLDAAVWRALPDYRAYSFAVFQLAPHAQPTEIHPMALRYRPRDPTTLFFPTVHVHDGVVHDRAGFDHELYAQVHEAGVFADPNWTANSSPLRRVVDVDRVGDVLDVDLPCYRTGLFGDLPNRDTQLVLARDTP